MRVLTDNLDEALAGLLEDRPISRVDIATAWATEGSALGVLEALKRRRKGKLTVRTLAGFSGNHTTPDALKRLKKLGDVRLADNSAGLFHVKLYLFRSSRRSLAWIGSANLTGPGFDSNEELIYETEETRDLEAWFDRRWKRAGPQPDQPKRYCKEWEKPDVPMRGVAIQPKEPKTPTTPSRRARGVKPRVMAFVQKGERPPPKTGSANSAPRYPASGSVRIGNTFKEYESAQERLKIVLEELQQRDPTFLERCWYGERFRKEGKSRYIARKRSGLGSKSFRSSATKLNSGWYLAGGKVQIQEKWQLILAAAEIAGFRVKVVGKKWQAETNANIKVGF